MSSRKGISWYKKLIVRGTIEEINAKESSPFRRPTEALTNDVIDVDSISCFLIKHPVCRLKKGKCTSSNK